jgi:hypothetical protein
MFTVLLTPDIQYRETHDRFDADLEGIAPALSFYKIGVGVALSAMFKYFPDPTG